MQRPDPSEYAPYYQGYIDQTTTEEDLLTVMDGQANELRSVVGSLPEDRGSFAYAEGKWTIKELLSHIIDGERIFGYRAHRISRGDATPIEGFEQDDYIPTSNANARNFADLLDEFDLQRRANMLMLRNISDDAGSLMGTASGNPVSARAIAHIMAGHVRHHVKILQTRYLS
ncbi:MAG TPA: DinB family protein [Pyrinomonadaceae bacterium]|nr:DinB family protein [Pyrinomonadaceae bacterium]